MSNVIEDAVVKMQFDNQGFEKNVSQSLGTLDKLKNALNFKSSSEGLDNLGSKMKQLPLQNLSNAVNTVGQRFSAMEVIGVTALANITNSVVNTGRQMLRSLTIAPISQGFGEYELKLNSVQTIMAATGESIDKVNGYLDELNTYADRTIYSFSDMTQNIAKFTNAGVSLKDAVAAIQGISNEAALAGANTWEASRAMYNFAQALSSGYVKYIDWKSIEMANMATVQFKEELLKTALELKTVTKEGNKYRSLTTDLKGKTSDAFTASKDFNDSLKYQWMTTEVLTKTLAKYADETTKLGKDAYHAAQDVKTFTQLMDTLKEAVGSGWARTFEILFGDLNQAKKLWTSVNNVVGSFVDKTSQMRNFKLEIWSGGAGKEQFLEGLEHVFMGIYKLTKPLSTAFKRVFEPITGGKLVQLSKGFNAIAKSFSKIGDNLYIMNRLTYIFEGLFSAIKIIGQIGKGVIDGFFKPLLTTFSQSTNFGFKMAKLLDTIADFAKKVTDTRKSWSAYNKTVEISTKILNHTIDVTKALADAWGFILHTIEAAANAIKNAIDKISSTIKGKLLEAAQSLGLFKDMTQDEIKGFKILITVLASLWAVFNQFKSGFGIINSGFQLLIKSITGENLQRAIDSNAFGNFLKGIRKDFKGLTKDASGTFKSLESLLVGLGSKVKAGALKDMGIGLALIAGGAFLLSKVDSGKLQEVTGALMAITVAVTAAAATLGMVEGSINKEGEKGGIIQGLINGLLGDKGSQDVIIGLGVSILLMAGALLLISKIPFGKMEESLTVLVLGLNALVAALQEIGKLDIGGKHMIACATAIYIVSGGLIALALALKIMSTINIFDMCTALVGMAVGLMAMGHALSMLGQVKVGGKRMLAIAASIYIVSGALLSLSVALKLLSTIPLDKMGIAVLGLAGGLSALGGILYVLTTFGGSGKKMIAAAAAMYIISSGLLAMAIALKVVSGIDPDALLNTVFAIGAMLALMTGALLVLGTFGGLMLQAASAIAILAFALDLLIPAIVVFGAIPFAIIAAGLGNLALCIGVIIGLGALASLAAAGLLTLGASMLMISTSIYLFAAAMPLLAKNMGKLPQIAKEGGKAFVALVTTIVSAMPQIVKAVLKSIADTLNELRKGLPKIIKEFSGMIVAVLDALAEAAPELTEAGVNLMVSLIGGLGDAIDKHSDEIADAVVKLGVAIVKTIAKIGKKIYKALNKLTGGALDKITHKVGKFLKAGKDLITGLWKGITNAPLVKKITNAVAKIGGALLKKFKEIFGIKSPSRVMKKMGGYIMTGLDLGIKAGEQSTLKQVDETFGQIIVEAQKKLSVGEELGKTFMKDVSKGIHEMRLEKSVSAMLKPSIKVTKKMTGQVVSGFGIKIKDAANSGIVPGSKVFTKVVNSAQKKLKYGRGPFKEFINYYAKGAKGAKDLKNAVNGATGALNAYAIRLYKNSELYKQDRDAIKSAKKELKKYRKELEAAKKKGGKDLKQAKENLKNAKETYTDAVNSVTKHIQQSLQSVKTSIADAVKSFMDPLSIELRNVSSLFDTPIVGLDDIKAASDKVDVLTKELEKLEKQYEEMEHPNSRAGQKLYAQIEEKAVELGNAQQALEDLNATDPETMVKNMEAQAKVYDTFQKNLTAVAKAGLSPELVQYLKEQGIEANDKLVTFARMTPEQIQRANAAYSANAKDTVTQWLDTWKDKISEASKWGKDMEKLGNMDIDQTLLRALGDMGPESQKYIDALLSMSKKKFSKFQSTYKKDLKLDDKIANQVIASYMMAGTNSADAFAKGISKGLSAVSKASQKMAKKAIESMYKYLGLSTSTKKKSTKKTESKLNKAGKNAGTSAVKAYSKGITQGTKKESSKQSKKTSGTTKYVKQTDLSQAAYYAQQPRKQTSTKKNNKGKTTTKGNPIYQYRDALTSAVKTVGGGFEGIGDESDIIYEPIIRPVVDLSNVEQANTLISDYFGPTNSDATTLLANDISNTNNIAQSDLANQFINSIKEQTAKLEALLAEDRINQTNEFNITSNDPEGVANEVSKILQSQVERRNAVWA